MDKPISEQGLTNLTELAYSNLMNHSLTRWPVSDRPFGESLSSEFYLDLRKKKKDLMSIKRPLNYRKRNEIVIVYE